MSVQKIKVSDPIIANEVGWLISQMQIDVGSDKTAEITPGNKIGRANTTVVTQSLFHKNDSLMDLRIKAQTPTGKPIHTALQGYSLVLKDRQTQDPVGQTKIEDGTALLSNISPGQYTLELAKIETKPAGPKLDVRLKELRR
jgi:hypothetical protein